MLDSSFSPVLNYKGSALDYIRKFIIPTLPNKYNVIKFTLSINDYLKSSSIKYVRKFKNYPYRGNVYEYEHNAFTVTDNEPALWAYMECHSTNLKSFSEYERNRIFPVAFAIRNDERQNFDERFICGKKPREKDFSSRKFKHCHILDCAPRGVGINELSLNQRMLRLMSPMNHFPFPAPKHFNMKGGDIGELTRFQQLIKKVLYNDFYLTADEKKSYLSFLTSSGDDPFTHGYLDDFEIEFNLKKQNLNINNPKAKNLYLEQKKHEGSAYDEVKTYFQISESWYGEGKKIRVQFNRGIHQHCSFIYDHDVVYKKTIHHLKSLSAWNDYGNYSSSNNIPSWAKDHVEQVNRLS